MTKILTYLHFSQSCEANTFFEEYGHNYDIIYLYVIVIVIVRACSNFHPPRETLDANPISGVYFSSEMFTADC